MISGRSQCPGPQLADAGGQPPKHRTGPTVRDRSSGRPPRRPSLLAGGLSRDGLKPAQYVPTDLLGLACERLEDELWGFALERRPKYRPGILSDAPASTCGGASGNCSRWLIDAVVLSGEIKALKPGPRGFVAVLDAPAVHQQHGLCQQQPGQVDRPTALGILTVPCTTAEENVTALKISGRQTQEHN
jgi:hypothetical protein